MHRLFTDRTGIDEDEIGSARIIGELIPLMGIKFRDHVLRIAYIHRASERLDKKFLGHSTTFITMTKFELSTEENTVLT
jgi:hypothetical protein